MEQHKESQEQHVHLAAPSGPVPSAASEDAARPVAGAASTQQDAASDPWGWMHIFSQHSEHDFAQIVGDRIALEGLAQAISLALAEGDCTSRAMFTNDGEGYSVLVECRDNLSELHLPYIYKHEGQQVTYWRQRAFEAEAQLYRQRKASEAA